MKIEVSRIGVEEITPLRELHRQATNCQIMHDSFARRGFSDAYLIHGGDQVAGYGLVANVHWPETVHEFYLTPAHRPAALPIFRQLLEASQATHILAQTNDRLQTLRSRPRVAMPPIWPPAGPFKRLGCCRVRAFWWATWSSDARPKERAGVVREAAR